MSDWWCWFSWLAIGRDGGLTTSDSVKAGETGGVGGRGCGLCGCFVVGGKEPAQNRDGRDGADVGIGVGDGVNDPDVIEDDVVWDVGGCL